MYEVRLNDPTVIKLDHPVRYGDKTFEASYIELGNPGLPHCVVRFDGWDQLGTDELRKIGKALRYDSAFPKGANVTFVKVVGPTELKAVTYERGVEDFTLACGTGCGSTVSALALLGVVTGDNVQIAMPGGNLYVTITAESGTVRDIRLTGPTNVVCVGEVRDEDLNI
jgi:diaminopimelate epimerase